MHKCENLGMGIPCVAKISKKTGDFTHRICCATCLPNDYGPCRAYRTINASKIELRQHSIWYQVDLKPWPAMACPPCVYVMLGCCRDVVPWAQPVNPTLAMFKSRACLLPAQLGVRMGCPSAMGGWTTHARSEAA